MSIQRLHPQMKAATGGRLKYTPAYEALRAYVRVPAVEDDVSLLVPGEFHAGTSPLIQMLRQGHHGVRLDDEALDRLVTWIDLNAPCHGTWSDVFPIPDGVARAAAGIAATLRRPAPTIRKPTPSSGRLCLQASAAVSNPKSAIQNPKSAGLAADRRTGSQTPSRSACTTTHCRSRRGSRHGSRLDSAR